MFIIKITLVPSGLGIKARFPTTDAFNATTSLYELFFKCSLVSFYIMLLGKQKGLRLFYFSMTAIKIFYLRKLIILICFSCFCLWTNYSGHHNISLRRRLDLANIKTHRWCNLATDFRFKYYKDMHSYKYSIGDRFYGY